MQGGDLWSSLRGPDAAELRWYARGRTLALDVARGLHFLHEHKVRGCKLCSKALACALLLKQFKGVEHCYLYVR